MIQLGGVFQKETIENSGQMLCKDFQKFKKLLLDGFAFGKIVKNYPECL